jgi:hypothetical protein
MVRRMSKDALTCFLQQGMARRVIASTMVYLKGVRNSDIQARINKGSLAAFA